MIGQSMINVTSGGKLRISGITASLVLLIIILIASPIIDLIPMGGLIGVMFMVVYYTFEWGSLQFIVTIFMPETTRAQAGLHTVKVNRADAITVVIVTVVTIFTNLAVAVFCGIIFTALNFAWTEGKQIGFVGDDQDGLTAGVDVVRDLTEEEHTASDLLGFKTTDGPGDVCPAEPEEDEGGNDEKQAKAAAAKTLGLTDKNWKTCSSPALILHRTYDIEGTLFFAATTQFIGLFTPEVLDSCPKYITLRFKNGEVADFSGIEALRALGEMFATRGKTLNLTELSPGSKRMMDKGKSHIEEVEYTEASLEIETTGAGTTGLRVEGMGRAGEVDGDKEKRP